MSPNAAVIAVGIPARDEEERISACIDAVARAAGRVEQPVCLVVAADRCTDSTIDAADRALTASRAFASWAVITVGGDTVGSTRNAACVAAIELARAATANTLDTGIWLATTDADSRVPPDWFQAHLRHRSDGAHGVAGLVELDPTETPHLLDRRFRSTIEALGNRDGHPHIHGANLGLCADWFTRAGGFPPVSVGEDRALWQTVHSMGAYLHAAGDLSVTTSSRLQSRTPDGFAGYLRCLVEDDGVAS